jgi:mannan polymerase II complex MNN10 subunit
VDYEAPLKPTSSGVWWHKFAMARRIVKSGEYDWIWWIDFDSLITNMSISLTYIIDEALEKAINPTEVDFLLNEDW